MYFYTASAKKLKYIKTYVTRFVFKCEGQSQHGQCSGLYQLRAIKIVRVYRCTHWISLEQTKNIKRNIKLIEVNIFFLAEKTE